MYNVAVPITSENLSRQGIKGLEKLTSVLNKINVKRVVLALSYYTLKQEKREKILRHLKENCSYLKKQGFEVVAWTWAFGMDEKNDFTRMKSFSGKESSLSCCPLDTEFRKFVADYLIDIAKCGVDIIMFDDDFRYQHLDCGVACVCDLHLKKIREILNEDIDAEELFNLAFTGGENKYRNAWIEANRYGLEIFAREMREAVNKVDPKIRLGACSCLSSWNSDGIKPYELAKILAGETKPFFRSIGAPYWAVDKHWNNRLNDIFEVQRLEASLTPKDIEMFAEGDVFPRPRYKVPASFLELYDLLIRADGRQNGILKYMLDYTSNIDYEKGYIDHHIKDEKLFSFVEDNFSDKEALGVRVYEDTERINKMKLSPKDDIDTIVNYLLFFPEGRYCAELSIPSVYSGDGICSMAFGESVLKVPENVYSNGVITDIIGASLLKEKGIDIGLIDVKGTKKGKLEHFIEDDEFVPSTYDINVVSLKNKAKVLSEFLYAEGDKDISTPATYCYTNNLGQKFFVINTKMYLNDETSIRTYARANQTKYVIENYFNKKMPCSCMGNPDLYLMCKGDENEKVVGLWNTSYDEIYEPIVEIDGSYSKIECCNCDVKVENGKVFLSKLSAYSFAGFKLTK